MPYGSKMSVASGAEWGVPGLLSAVSAHEDTFEAGRLFPPTVYQGLTLVYQLSGENTARIGGADLVTRGGDLCLYARQTRIAWERTARRGALRVHYLRMVGPLADEVERVLALHPIRPLILADAPRAWGFAVDRLTRLVFDRPAGWAWVFIAQMGELVGEMVAFRAERHTPAARWVERVRLLVEGSPRHDWSAKEIAQALGVCRDTLWQAFRSETGRAPAAWLRHRRMELARAMLTRGLSVAEVTARLGFSSRQHFARSYKSVMGHPPSGRPSPARKRPPACFSKNLPV